MMRFVAAGAAQGLVAAVAREAGVEVEGSFGAVGAMLDKFKSGEACDVLILTNAQIAELTARSLVIPETSADLGSVPTAIAVRNESELPDVSNEAALRAALVAADAIYFPDPARATAGIHFAKVLDQLGIREKVEGRIRTHPNGATAMRAMAEAGGNPIGCTQATEILATPGVRLVQPLPKGFDLDTVYTAAVAATSSQAKSAAGLVARLAGEAGRAARIKAGFRGYVIRPADGGDAAEVRDVVRRVLAEYGLEPDPRGVDADLEDLDVSYTARGGLFDVAVGSDGALAGCCGIYPVDSSMCELRKMYLLPEARGHGIGGRLLRRALAFARGRGFRRVELETASELKEAIALYAGAGFQPIPRAHLAARCDQAFALDL
ncbi:MAG: GNAT family N-acetyltransferase [Burkholderiales bacterium]|nr:GNAT family N-acetyltransferase [Burkholderiales bacterium]